MPRKRFLIAAIISRELNKIGVQAVVVGGSAVELYANDASRYATQDIDMVLTRTDGVSEIMQRCGFTSEGGIWGWGSTDIIVEFPPGPLAGSWDKIITINADKLTDVAVTYLGLEDVIIDRCNDYKNWQTERAVIAAYLIAVYYDKLDLLYLKQRAREELCYDIVKRFIKQHRININHVSEENPRRKQYFTTDDYTQRLENLTMDLNTYEDTAQIILAQISPKVLKRYPHWGVVGDIFLLNELKKDGFDEATIRNILFFSPNGYKLNNYDRLIRVQNMLRRYKRYEQRGTLEFWLNKQGRD